MENGKWQMEENSSNAAARFPFAISHLPFSIDA
jgi:hypothetical protein